MWRMVLQHTGGPVNSCRSARHREARLDLPWCKVVWACKHNLLTVRRFLGREGGWAVSRGSLSLWAERAK